MEYGLVADIGGTNARFALAPIKSTKPLALTVEDLQQVQTLNGTDFDSISLAIKAYLDSLPAQYGEVTKGCLAIACPTENDWIAMTNHTWAFSVQSLKAELGFQSLEFINDYHALANSILFLGEQGAVQVGSGQSAQGKPMVVTGPGTGLGLGALVFSGESPETVCTEGGHSHFAATNEVELQIVSYLLQKFDRVSSERLISGQGLENIYEALTFIRNGEAKQLAAPAISAAALDANDAICVEALEVFCSVLGSFAGDAALMFGAKGGVFIAGGIIPRFMEFFENSQFRSSFENKARFSEYNAEIPTYVILNEQPGLLGSAAVLNYIA